MLEESIGADNLCEIDAAGDRFGLHDHRAHHAAGGPGGDGFGTGELDGGDQARGELGVSFFDAQGDFVFVGAARDRQHDVADDDDHQEREIDREKCRPNPARKIEPPVEHHADP